MSGGGTGFSRSQFKNEVTRTEDWILSVFPELAGSVQFQRRSRNAMVRSTRKWCLLHVMSLEATCAEAEAKFPIDSIPKKHLK